MKSPLQFFLQALLVCNICSGISSLESSLEDDIIAVDPGLLFSIYKRVLQAGARNPEILRAYHQHSILPTNEFTSANKTPQFLQSSPSLSKDYSSSECNNALVHTLLSAKQPWATKMIDAFGKPASGIQRGEITWPGNYDECLQVSAPSSNNITEFKGNYVWLVLGNVSASIKIGGCLPSSCSKDYTILKDYEDFRNFLGNISFFEKAVEKLPQLQVAFVPTEYPLSGASIACIVVCCIIGAMVTVGTAVDIYKRYSKKLLPKINNLPPDDTNVDSEASQLDSSSVNNDTTDTSAILTVNIHDAKSLVSDFLVCFSALSNAESILDMTSGQGQLQCLHGIRFLSMAWVILGHTYYNSFAYFGNILDLLDLANTWPIQVILQGSYSVDTFFLLSGCLMAYLYFKNQHQLTSFKDWVIFYVHRYVRLTPVYAMLMFVLATWYNNLGRGPFWNQGNADSCEKTWWWNILYINNFLQPLKMCMGWTWYLANDMQFFVISPLFLLAFKRNRIAGLTVVFALLVASWIATGVISRVNHLVALCGNDVADLAVMQQQQMDFFTMVYVKPYTRIGPYLIGVLLGFVLYEVRGKQKFLNKYAVIIGWILSQGMSLTLIYGMLNCQLGPITSSAQLALSRTAWGITVAWVIFACLTGHGGPVNTLLSWKIWIPLSRLTYCAYLIHPMLMMWYITTLRTTLYFSTALIVSLYLSFMVLSYGIAFTASLMFEAPIMKLEKFLKKL